MSKQLTKEQIEAIYNPGFHWMGRNLENYKQMQANVAAKKGVTNELKGAKTLTAARKIAYGFKKKNTK